MPDVTTPPLLLFRARMEGNDQIASMTALILLIASVGFMLLIERFVRADGLARSAAEVTNCGIAKNAQKEGQALSRILGSGIAESGNVSPLMRAHW